MKNSKILIIFFLGWLVTWNVHNSHLVSCCEGEPTFFVDEFGRETLNPCFTYAMACWEDVITEKSIEFDTKKLAEDFVKRGQDQSDLSNFKIQVDNK